MGGISQIMHSILNWQPSGSPEWSAQQSASRGQQQVDIEKAQEERAKEEADIAFHQMVTGMGAKYVHPESGLVNDTTTMTIPGREMPDGSKSGDQEIPFSFLRPADKSKIIKHKASDGPVSYEMPSAIEQAQNRLAAGAPERSSQVQQAGAVAGAQETGKAGAQQDILEKYGVPLDDQTADFYHLPRGMKVLREQLAQMGQRATPAVIRADASTANAETRANAAKSIADAKNQATADEAQTKLDYQDRWQKARNARLAANPNGVQARFDANQFDKAQKEHGSVLHQAFEESQKQLDAQAILDEQTQSGPFGYGSSNVPVTGDGQEFTNPFSGKKVTMNYAQRVTLKGQLAASQLQTNSLRQRADEIEKRYLAPTPPAQAAPPANGAGAATPQKIATKAQVQAYAKQKGIPEDAATKEFTSSGYQVK